MTTLKIGIASYETMKKRTMAIARGEYKPKRGEPKVWFPSLEAFAGILSENNRALLQIIIDSQPGSLTELANLSGRKTASLSRTLKSMAHYGLVDLEKDRGGRLRPRVKYTDVALDLPIAKEQERIPA
ncbi:MAG: transcriptional regulator [Alphaproteobacteria bacterium]|jgi:predicted transcriptional regulator|nr:transcriptional regulator [Alphaproteobacteria bacterium]MDP6830840.1 transcriptional regulator [Alphaproteobacteria bacterium]MDP6876528.1 transcriptional regulator [Alphaproteobacteria bacterium]